MCIELTLEGNFSISSTTLKINLGSDYDNFTDLCPCNEVDGHK